MGGKKGKKSKKKGGGLSAGQKKARKKLASLGRAPKSFGGPTKAQTMAKNRIAAKKATPSKAASMGATDKSFTSGLPSYSSLTSPTEAKKMCSPKADKGPSFSKSLAMATTPAPKLEDGTQVSMFKSKYPAADNDNMSTKEFREMMLPGLRPVPVGESIEDTRRMLINEDLLSKKQGPVSNIKDFGFGYTLNEGATRIKPGSVRFKEGYTDTGLPKADAGCKSLGGILTAFNPVAGMTIGALGTPANAATVDNKYSPTIGGLDKMLGFNPVSYTHLTLPTLLLV